MNGWLGPWELLLIIIIALILFGPKKIPEIARTLGQAVAEFRKASQAIYGVKNEIESTKKELESTLKMETPISKSESKPEKITQESKEHDYERRIIELAKKLNIQTENKPLDQIISEIEAKLKELEAQRVSEARKG